MENNLRWSEFNEIFEHARRDINDLLFLGDSCPLFFEKLKPPFRGDVDANFLENPHHRIMDLLDIGLAERTVLTTLEATYFSPLQHVSSQ